MLHACVCSSSSGSSSSNDLVRMMGNTEELIVIGNRRRGICFIIKRVEFCGLFLNFFRKRT